MSKNLKLKLKRIEQGMTQKDIAEKLQISIPAYSLIESGKRKGSLEFWENVQKVLNIDNNEMWEVIRHE